MHKCCECRILDGLFGSSGNITNISTFQFNIPEGYTLDEDEGNLEEDVGWYIKDATSGTIKAGSVQKLGFANSMKVEIKDNDYTDIPNGAKVLNESYKHYSNSNGDDIYIYIRHPFNGTEQTAEIMDLNINKNIKGIDGEFKDYDDSPDECFFEYIKDGSYVKIYAKNEDMVSNMIVN